MHSPRIPNPRGVGHDIDDKTAASLKMQSVAGRMEEVRMSLYHYSGTHLPSAHLRTIAPLLDELGILIQRVALLASGNQTREMYKPIKNKAPTESVSESVSWQEKARAQMDALEEARRQAREARQKEKDHGKEEAQDVEDDPEADGGDAGEAHADAPAHDDE